MYSVVVLTSVCDHPVMHVIAPRPHTEVEICWLQTLVPCRLWEQTAKLELDHAETQFETNQRRVFVSVAAGRLETQT